jgi:hypothetical protein
VDIRHFKCWGLGLAGQLFRQKDYQANGCDDRFHDAPPEPRVRPEIVTGRWSVARCIAPDIPIRFSYMFVDFPAGQSVLYDHPVNKTVLLIGWGGSGRLPLPHRHGSEKGAVVFCSWLQSRDCICYRAATAKERFPGEHFLKTVTHWKPEG